MIYVIVGPSHAGKTSFTVNSFMDPSAKPYKDIVWITECEKSFLIGNYCIEKRARGSDYISRQDIVKIKDQIQKLFETSPKDIVLEGDKICSSKIMNKIMEIGAPCKMYYIKCSLNTSIQRNMAFNSTVSRQLLQTVASKARNLYQRYSGVFDGEYVETDDIRDFTKFCKDSTDVVFHKGAVVDPGAEVLMTL